MTNERKKAKQKYKAQPPYVNLKYVLDVVGQVYSKCAGTASRDSFSSIINNSIKSSSFKKKLNACTKFGLLKEENKKILLTPLAQKIVAPHTNEEESIAKKEAFLNIKIFGKVYDKFCGKILDLTYLPNFFEREIKINHEVKNKWAESFIECGKTAGLLSIRGDGKYTVLEGIDAPPSGGEKENGNGNGKPESDSKQGIEVPPNKQTNEDEVGQMKYHYHSKVGLSDGKYAEFLIPDSLNEKDARKVKKHLEGLMIIIEGNVIEEIEE